MSKKNKKRKNRESADAPVIIRCNEPEVETNEVEQVEVNMLDEFEHELGGEG